MNAVRWMGLLALVGMTGCTTVRLERRDGCWLRQTEKWGRVTEEIGPCPKDQTQWVNDRPTRLVQECVADASWRWHNDALAAWQRGEVPETPPVDATLLEACQAEAARTLTQQNEALQTQLTASQADRERVLTHNEHLADVLGEAAIKPAGNATATANADGRSTSTNDTKASHQADVSTQTPVSSQAPIVVPYQPAEKPVIVYFQPKAAAPTPVAPKPVVKTAVTKAKPEPIACEPNQSTPACECACDDSGGR